MIHTATLYCDISLTELNRLAKKHSTDIYTILSDLDDRYIGFSSHIHYQYTYAFYFNIDFIKLLGKANINDSDYATCEKIINEYLANLNLNINYF